LYVLQFNFQFFEIRLYIILDIIIGKNPKKKIIIKIILKFLHKMIDNSK
jgi:hypothetical protein